MRSASGSEQNSVDEHPSRQHPRARNERAVHCGEQSEPQDRAPTNGRGDVSFCRRFLPTSRRLVVQKGAAEGSKPPSVRSGIRLSTRRGLRATNERRACTGEDSPFHRSHSIGVLRVSFLPSRVGSRASSLRSGRVVAVPVPAVSRSGRVSSRLPGRWGDFPRHRGPTPGKAVAGLPLPSAHLPPPTLNTLDRATGPIGVGWGTRNPTTKRSGSAAIDSKSRRRSRPSTRTTAAPST